MVSEVDKSEFNDAIGYLRNINKYFIIMNASRIKYDLDSWHSFMETLYGELYNFVPEADREKRTQELFELKDEVNTFMNRRKNNPFIPVPKELYQKLFTFQLYIKRIYGKSGMETRIMDDATRALK
jgi:hypothetical protein